MYQNVVLHIRTDMYRHIVPFSFVLSFRFVVFGSIFVRFVVFRLFLVSPSSLFFSLPCFP